MAAAPTYTAEECSRNAAAKAIIPINAIYVALSTITIVLRLHTRRLIAKAFWWDDALMLVAYLLSVVVLGLSVPLISAGLGRYEKCLAVTDIITTVKYSFIGSSVLILSGMFSRMSIALFVTRLFGVSRTFRISLYSWTVFMALSMATFPVCTFLQCIPMEGLWDITIPSKCWPKKSQEGYMYYNAAVSIASDCLCASLPLYYLWKLQMRPKLKTLVYALFGLGLVVPVCTIVRTALQHTLTGTVANNSRDNALTVIFGSSEIYMLIICGNIPSLAHYFNNDRYSKRIRRRQAQDPDQDEYNAELRPKKVSEPWPPISLETFENDSSSAARASKGDEASLPSGNSLEVVHVTVK